MSTRKHWRGPPRWPRAPGPDPSTELDEAIIATGGIYDAQTKMASSNSVEPYLRFVFGFIRVKDVTFITAGGTKVLSQGHDRQAFSLRVFRPHIRMHKASKELPYENRFNYCTLLARSSVHGIWPKRLSPLHPPAATVGPAGPPVPGSSQRLTLCCLLLRSPSGPLLCSACVDSARG